MFFFYCSAHHRDLHSFPTRRSSDLDYREVKPMDATSAARAFDAVSAARIFIAEHFPECAAALLAGSAARGNRSEEHTSELQSPYDLVCRLLLEKKKRYQKRRTCRRK